MVPHRLVDVEAGRRRGVEAGQQLVHHDQELHPPRLLHETPLHLLLEALHLVHRRLFRLVEMRREHLSIDVVLAQLLGEPFAGLLALEVRCGRPVGSDDGAPVLQIGPVEHLEDAAGRVDAVGDEQRVAAPALQPVARLHVEQDVGDDLLQPVPCAQHLAHRAPALLELGLRDVAQPPGLRLEPPIDPVFGSEALIDVARLVAQIQHHAVAHRFVVLVGMDVGTEELDAALLVVLEQRRPGESDQHRIRQQLLHRLVQLPGLGAVALVHEDEHPAPGVEPLGQVAAEVLDEGVDVAFLRRAELVDQRADQPFVAGVERPHEIGAAAGAVNGFADALEDPLDLLVQLGAVGDDQHPAAGHVLADPLREPDHGQALAATLGVPDDAALAAPDARLCRPHPEVLVVAAGLLHARIEDHEVVHDLEQPLPGAELAQFPEQRIVPGGRVGVGLLPAQPVLLRRPGHAVAQPFGLVARHHELHGGEEGADELLLLAVEALADPFAHRHRGALELQHAEGDAVDVEHEVRPPGVLPGDGHLLGDGEVVGAGVRPVDDRDGDGVRAGGRPDLRPVAEQAVDLAVGVVEGPAAADRGGPVQLAQRLADEPVVVALSFEEAGEQRFFDVGVAGAARPVPEAVVAERVAEERGHAPLGAALPLADEAHFITSQRPAYVARTWQVTPAVRSLSR